MGSESAVRRTIWRWVLPSLLAVVLLYFSLRGVEWRRVWTTIATARWQYIVAAGLITCWSFFLRSYRWRILLNAEAHFSVGTVFWANMAGYLGNSFLPARAGELVRSFIISNQSSLTMTHVLTTALTERTMDAIALVLWSSVVLLGVNPKPRWLDGVGRTMAVIAGAGLLAIIVLPHSGNLCQAIVRRLPLPAALQSKLLTLAQQVLLGLRAFHNVKRMAGFGLLTVMIWLSDAASVIAGAAGLGLHFSFAVALLLLAGLGLSSALPSTPGYVGIYQFVAVSVLTPFGVSHDLAVANILVWQAIGYVVVLVFGLPGIYRFRGWRRAGITSLPSPAWSQSTADPAPGAPPRSPRS